MQVFTYIKFKKYNMLYYTHLIYFYVVMILFPVALFQLLYLFINNCKINIYIVVQHISDF